MASSSTLDPDNFPIGSKQRGTLKGHDLASLGPSDSSDTGSDLGGSRPAAGDGLNRGADEGMTGDHANDIDTDRIVDAGEAGLGGGLDQAEEAKFGMQDDPVATGRGRDSSSQELRRRQIAEAAYYRAQRRGFAPGQEDDDWLAAEKELAAGGE
ncbi:MAG: DUF2934 domain-containing protein [Burkholderiales bacterium]